MAGRTSNSNNSCTDQNSVPKHTAECARRQDSPSLSPFAEGDETGLNRNASRHFDAEEGFERNDIAIFRNRKAEQKLFH